jgi:ABC-type glycerol-3-phosphate transport system permease component
VSAELKDAVAGRILWHAILVATIVAMVFPIAWAIVTSFKPPNEIYGLGLISAHPTLENYVYTLTKFPIWSLLGNTLIMACGVTAGQIAIAVLGAYALVSLNPPRRSLWLALLTGALLIPPQALIVPQFLITARLGWLNSEAGLIVPQLGACALAVLLLRQHIERMPASLGDAARLEGARPAEVLWKIVIPTLRPALAAVAILVFISSWNEYLWPLIATPGSGTTTVQLGLSQFQTSEGTDFGGLLAAATLTSLPVLLVYLIASRRITDAFLQSGLT